MKTNKNKLIYLLVTLVLTILITPSCEKEGEEDRSVGFSEDIENFVPDSTIQLLRDLGMVIHEGKEPPIIEGKFYMSPMLMDSSNVPNESYERGDRFVDYRLHFFNQNNDELSIMLDTEGLSTSSGDTTVISSSYGNGGFLSGYGNEFSVFIIAEGETYLNNNQDTARNRSLSLYSGEITALGIKNLKSAVLMLDDYGDEYNRYISINTGRLFYDGDSLSHRLSDSAWTQRASSFLMEKSEMPSIMENLRK